MPLFRASSVTTSTSCWLWIVRPKILLLTDKNHLFGIEKILIHVSRHCFTASPIEYLVFVNYWDLTFSDRIHEHQVKLVFIFNYLLKCLNFSCTQYAVSSCFFKLISENKSLTIPGGLGWREWISHFFFLGYIIFKRIIEWLSRWQSHIGLFVNIEEVFIGCLRRNDNRIVVASPERGVSAANLRSWEASLTSKKTFTQAFFRL